MGGKYLDGCWDKRSEDPLVSRFSTPLSFCSGMNRIETGGLFGLMIESSRTVESCSSIQRIKITIHREKLETHSELGLQISFMTDITCKTGLLAGDNSPEIITWKICTSNGL
jgi:hypothetical protein